MEWRDVNYTMERINETYFSFNHTFFSAHNSSFMVFCNTTIGTWANTESYELNSTNDTDVSPPYIYAIIPVSGTSFVAGTSTVTVQLNTNEISECRYSINTDKEFENMSTFNHTNDLFHQSNVSTASGTTYIYYFRCNDTNGNYNTASKSTSFSIASSGGEGGGGGVTTITYPPLVCETPEGFSMFYKQIIIWPFDTYITADLQIACNQELKTCTPRNSDVSCTIKNNTAILHIPISHIFKFSTFIQDTVDLTNNVNEFESFPYAANIWNFGFAVKIKETANTLPSALRPLLKINERSNIVGIKLWWVLLIGLAGLIKYRRNRNAVIGLLISIILMLSLF